MKQILITTIAAVVLAGCRESQQSTTPAETQPAETVAAATQTELPTDVSNRKLIKNFWFSYPSVPEPGYRMWERSNEGMWTENYPSGFKSMFKEVGRIKVDGLSGDYAVKVGGDSSKTQTVDRKFRVFIPDYSDTETFLYMSRKISDDWGEWEKSNYLIKVMTTRDGLKHGTAHGAVITRDVDGLRSLLNDGVNINAKDEDGKTPLDYANNEVAKILINHGAKTSDELKADERKLVDAARDGDIQKVKSYLAIGIDVNTIDEDGHIPLHWNVNNEVVKLLITKEANVNAISKHGRTPLDFAIMRGQEEAVETLRKHGGKTGAELKAAQTEPTTAKAPDIDIHDAAGARGRRGNIEAVKQHLAAGEDVDARDNQDKTPLKHAAFRGYKEIVELLIAKGADVNAKDNTGNTTLHWAVIGRRNEMVELLILNGANVNAKTMRGFTPLDEAIKYKRTETAALLRKHGAKSGAEDSIHIAARTGNHEAVKKHLAAGTDVNAKEWQFGTPLHHATMGGHKEIAELLISAGAKVNVKGGFVDGTPLHWAAYDGRNEIAELLITAGADVNANSDDDGTPLDWAIKYNHTKTADLLRKHGGKTSEELKAEAGL